jgi:non-heme chloroperoxidase
MDCGCCPVAGIAGGATITRRGTAPRPPGWPDDPESIERARANTDVFAKKMVGQVTDHYLEAIERRNSKPAVVGPSFGGLVAQKIAGEGALAASQANGSVRGARPPSQLGQSAARYGSDWYQVSHAPARR